MIEFLKQRKIIIIIVILVIIFIGWKFYGSLNNTDIENNDFLVNDTKTNKGILPDYFSKVVIRIFIL